MPGRLGMRESEVAIQIGVNAAGGIAGPLQWFGFGKDAIAQMDTQAGFGDDIGTAAEHGFDIELQPDQIEK